MSSFAPFAAHQSFRMTLLTLLRRRAQISGASAEHAAMRPPVQNTQKLLISVSAAVLSIWLLGTLYHSLIVNAEAAAIGLFPS
jgi:hypothetical protein